ncbi:MAG: hypothetical protein EBV79_10470, partial [Betaproteobacteria bacterium]|nr:hypothetical protein [Betaproteobacteria bacterium]
DSLDQGAMGIPVESIVLRADRSLVMRCRAVQGEFEGTLNAEATEIDGTWRQGGQELPLLLTRGEPPALKRPQEPKPPFPYASTEVRVPQTVDGITLAGTLTMPKNPGPVPAVILITGSGPQDRDETLLGHKPFLVIADALTRAGVAVLRLDDRGVGGSTGSLETATTVDLARDTAAAIDWLAHQPGIDPGHGAAGRPGATRRRAAAGADRAAGRCIGRGRGRGRCLAAHAVIADRTREGPGAIPGRTAGCAAWRAPRCGFRVAARHLRDPRSVPGHARFALDARVPGL